MAIPDNPRHWSVVTHHPRRSFSAASSSSQELPSWRNHHDQTPRIHQIKSSLDPALLKYRDYLTFKRRNKGYWHLA
jgi:hypothetical protein